MRKEEMKKILLFLVLFLSACGPFYPVQFAADLSPTIYVSGNGSGSACTQSQPCSIGTAVSLIQPGDVVQMLDTIAPFIITRSGTPSQPITFTGGTVDAINSSAQNGILVYGHDIILDGVTVINALDYGIRTKSNTIIQNSLIANNLKAQPSVKKGVERAGKILAGTVFKPLAIVENPTNTFAKFANNWYLLMDRTADNKVYAEFVECE